MRTTEAPEAAASVVEHPGFILAIDSPIQPLATLETNGGCSARKGDSVPDLELEEFALVRVYDGCSPPEG